jgi:hypothetical protein
LGALESWRVAEALATRLSADIADRGHAARVEPVRQVAEEGAHMADPVAQQRRSRHHDLRAHQQVFDRLIRALHAARRGERAATCPASTSIHNNGSRISAGVLRLQLSRIVRRSMSGLVEPIEQDEAARPTWSRRRTKLRMDSELPKGTEF